MSLRSYADLQSAVGDWMNRTDLTARVPDFIRLAEAKLRRRVKHNMALTGCVQFTMSGQSVPVPEDFNGVVALLSDDPGIPRIDYLDPNTFFNFVNNASGQPSGYTLLGGQLLIRPFPISVGLTLFYRQKLDLLTHGPNWVLEEHPDAYLYGALAEAEPYMVNDDRAPMWIAAFEKALKEIQMDGIYQASSGPVTMSSNNPLQVF